MKYRKLRIAWSAVCGILCLLLIALWVRSYWWSTTIRVWWPHSVRVQADFEDGGLAVWASWFDTTQRPLHTSKVWPGHGVRFKRWKNRGLYGSVQRNGIKFRRTPVRWDLIFMIPQWLPAMLCALIGAAAWLKPRFSLRTLLIATTLVAVVLGLVAMILRGS